MKHLRKILIFSLAVSFLPMVSACSKFSQSKRQEAQRRKQMEKEKERRDSEADKAYEEALQRHYDMQQKQTKRMMKQTAKKSYNFHENKKESFLKRWFTPKYKKAKTKRNNK